MVILPADVQNLAMEEPTLEHWVSRTGVGHASTAITPPDDELRRAAEVLNDGLEGRDAGRARARSARPTRSLAVAERLGAGIITALLGKGVVPATCRTTPSSWGCSAPSPATT